SHNLPSFLRGTITLCANLEPHRSRSAVHIQVHTGRGGMDSGSRAQLTPRDLELLEILTQRVRILSLEQIARTWRVKSVQGRKPARDRIEVLERAGLVSHFYAPAHPELPLTEPVLTWTPGDSDPDLGSVSYRLQSRWRLSPTPTFFVVASKSAMNRFGGHGGRVPVGTHRTHDLHLSTVFLLLRQRRPDDAAGWISEERIRRTRNTLAEKLPDAMIRNGSGIRVVEFGGSYPKKKLEAFHGYCAAQELPYEVW